MHHLTVEEYVQMHSSVFAQTIFLPTGGLLLTYAVGDQLHAQARWQNFKFFYAFLFNVFMFIIPLPWRHRPEGGQRLLNVEASRSYSDTPHTHSFRRVISPTQ